jgi:hypothetical protein
MSETLTIANLCAICGEPGADVGLGFHLKCAACSGCGSKFVLWGNDGKGGVHVRCLSCLRRFDRPGIKGGKA